MKFSCKCGKEIELTYDHNTLMYISYCKCGLYHGVGTLGAVEKAKELKRRKKPFLVEARIIN